MLDIEERVISHLCNYMTTNYLYRLKNETSPSLPDAKLIDSFHDLMHKFCEEIYQLAPALFEREDVKFYRRSINQWQQESASSIRGLLETKELNKNLIYNYQAYSAKDGLYFFKNLSELNDFLVNKQNKIRYTSSYLVGQSYSEYEQETLLSMTGYNSRGKEVGFHKFELYDSRDFGENTPAKPCLLSGFTDEYLAEYMLDLNDRDVVAILPYLLTAYIYNYPKSPVSKNDEDTISQALFDIRPDKSKRKIESIQHTIENLAACFSLRQKETTVLSSNFHEDNDINVLERPVALWGSDEDTIHDELPTLLSADVASNDLNFLWFILNKLIRIFSNGEQNVLQNINAALCKDLFSSRVEPYKKVLSKS